jgi:hypothetical protein
MLIGLQQLELLSLHPLPLQLLPAGQVHLHQPNLLDGLRVLVVVMVSGLSAIMRVRVLVLRVRVRVRVVLVDVGEGVLQDLEPSEVFVSLGLPVPPLATILVQNAIKGRSTHLNNSNQSKYLAFMLLLHIENTQIQLLHLFPSFCRAYSSSCIW